MHKTTIYLPDDLKRALERAAAARGISESELIREALRQLISKSNPPKPRTALFASGLPHLAEQADKYLLGFGDN